MIRFVRAWVTALFLCEPPLDADILLLLVLFMICIPVYDHNARYFAYVGKINGGAYRGDKRSGRIVCAYLLDRAEKQTAGIYTSRAACVNSVASSSHTSVSFPLGNVIDFSFSLCLSSFIPRNII